MKIWIDGQCLQTLSRYRGIGRYVLEWMKSLSEESADIEICISFNAQMRDTALQARDLVSPIIAKKNIYSWHGIASLSENESVHPTDRHLSELALHQHVLDLKPDIAICASAFEGLGDVAVPFLPSPNFPIPTCCIFYDAIPHRLPELYLAHNHLRAPYQRRLDCVAHFDSLLAISDYARQEALALFPSQKVENIGAGLSASFQKGLMALQRSKTRTSGSEQGVYDLLYIGGLDQRKNLPRLVEAISLLPEAKRATIILSVVGHYPHAASHALTNIWTEHGLPLSQLKMRGFLKDDDLLKLMRASDLLVQPSLLEGFGLTALEAMHSGTSILASNTGAVPEVVSEPDLTFDPMDTGDIAARLSWAMDNPEELQEKTERARKASSHFTWKNAAEKTLSHLQYTVDTKGEAAALDLPAHIQAILPNNESTDLLLKAARIHKPKKPNLYVDITSMTQVDHKTGIQRVVRSICERRSHFLASTFQDVELVASDFPAGFFPARVDNPDGSAWDADRHNIIGIDRDDTLLMLDSSWAFYTVVDDTLKLARLRGVEIYSVMYDLVPLKLPAFCHEGMPPVFRGWFEAALQYSTGFICISKTVADELINFLETIQFPRSMKVGYWHLGGDISKVTLGRPDHALGKKAGRHFLSVGTIEPRKGHTVIVEAFDRLWAEGSDDRLTLVGKEGWGVNDFARALENHPEAGRKLNWLNSIGDEELSAVYADCDALITSSYGEGFGLPIIEAQRMGKAVIASDIPVFREVAGEASDVTFFEVGSSESLAEIIRNFAETSGDVDRSVTRGLSWDESTQALAKVVMEKDWYHTYTPNEGVDLFGTWPLGVRAMAGPVANRSAAVTKLSVLSDYSGHAPSLSRPLLLKVENCSGEDWFSDGDAEGKYGVVVAVFADAALTDGPIARYPFTFCMPDGDTQYLPIGPIAHASTAALHVVVYQEGVGPMGVALALGDVKQSEMV